MLLLGSLPCCLVQVCEDCPNVKFEREPEVLTVSVEPGMPDGHEITFFEEGELLCHWEPIDSHEGM